MFGFLRRAERARQAAAAAPPRIVGPNTAGSAALTSENDSGHAGRGQTIEPEALLRQMEWTVVRRLEGLLQGDHRTLFRGHGFDLADLREYQASDDVRFIDWNVTARLQTPHVREHQEDREASIWMLIDLSGSVDFGSGTVTKRMLATRFCAVMARLLTARGNRVGARLLTDQKQPISVIVPRTGRTHLLHLVDRIGATRSASGDPAETDLSRLLSDGLRGVRRRSAIFVVSDFISRPGWENAMGWLAQRHDVVAVRLFDPLEQSLPDLGMIALRDAETDELIWVDSADPMFRSRLTALAESNEKHLRASLARAGVDCLELSTDEDLGDALVRFMVMRKRRAQLAAGTVPRSGPSRSGV